MRQPGELDEKSNLQKMQNANGRSHSRLPETRKTERGAGGGPGAAARRGLWLCMLKKQKAKLLKNQLLGFFVRLVGITGLELMNILEGR